MISKRIACKPKNDNYGRLANYIADADHAGEKSLIAWCEGCWAGDDYELAIQEVKDTQALNTRTSKEKTYHLMISFRPEDEAKLTPEIFREIEKEFAEALGFSEHQRHCGVHQNTANSHMHVAYNMIHPEKLTRHEPYRDYWKRDKACREIERKYGLTVDQGREKERTPDNPALIPAAATVEAQTGQESFDGYAKRHKPEIMAELEKAEGWQDVHKALARYGMAIKLQGNGLALVSQDGKNGVKASNFDRSFSKTRLEKRFGAYEAPGEKALAIRPEQTYTRRPLQKIPGRGQLFKQYQAGITERISLLDLVSKAEHLEKQAVADKWERERSRIKELPLPIWKKFELLRLYRANQKIDTANRLAAEYDRQREAVKQKYPYSSWNQFLRWQAEELGNETALAILRSRDEAVEPEKDYQPDSKWADREKEILMNDKLLREEKTALLSIVKMKALAERQAAWGNADFAGLKHRIDNKGTVIFTLEGGQTIRDNGKTICFSNDEKARAVAELYARAKWGNKAILKDNQIVFRPGGKKVEKTTGMEI